MHQPSSEVVPNVEHISVETVKATVLSIYIYIYI